ncbi:carbohydrate kinase [Nonomuraea sp. SMC257]|uniref:Carbohydrate kinase n=1 Tax=Nonomuraea montanisoli TaxID=2741721 RepID=A0A7Y6IA44_9ACTN|nr:carbohydrate kinase [Nonomuraea montanisoli]NUW34221.1 carbohydrate kinase [Nonomuraea montanisoli]
MIAVLGECVADAFAEHEPGPGTARRSPEAAPGSGAASARAGSGELTLRVHAGGGPANTAVALARLGTPTRFLGRLSGDVFGRLFRDRLASSGVDLSACVEAAEPSTLAVASLDERGQAAYGFHAEGAADWAWTAAELDSRGDLGGASCLHTGSLALVREPGRDAVEAFAAAAAQRATVSIDPNVRPSLAPRVAYDVTRWCAFADILRLSEDDLAFLAPDEPVERVCDLWHAAGAPLVIVTRGGAGALVSLNGERAEVAAPRVTVVDTVGAGDAFTAGLLHRLDRRGLLGGRLDGLDLGTAVDAAAFAARVAALTCAVAGANPPWARDLDDRASA